MRGKIPWHMLVALWLCAPLSAGCNLLSAAPTAKSPLVPLTLAHDAADLEVVLVRIPAGDAELGDALWKDVDEQSFSGELRRELASNGIRAGVVGQLPDALSRRLAAADSNSPAAAAARVQGESPVWRSRLQLHRGRPGKIVTSNVNDQISLLTRDDDGTVHGQTYMQAQALMMIQVDPQPDGRVRIQLTPTIQHGQPRQQFVGEDGMLRPEWNQPRQSFARLKIDAVLAQNQTLLVTSIPERSGSLGRYLFAQSGPAVEQKLLMIRLSQSKFDDLFADATAGDMKPVNPLDAKPAVATTATK